MRQFPRCPSTPAPPVPRKETREQCLAAGMDHCISKPVKGPELVEAVEGAVPEPEGVDGGYGVGTALRTEVLSRLGGDRELLSEISSLFLSECPRHLEKIGRAIAEGDGEGLESAAHALKGAVAIFTQEGPFKAALRLEELGQASDLGRAGEVYQALQEEIDRLEPLLVRMAEDKGE